MSIVDRTIEALDLQSAERQAKFIAGNLRIQDSAGESHPAQLYSVEQTKEADEQPIPRDPFSPKPQRRFAA